MKQQIKPCSHEAESELSQHVRRSWDAFQAAGKTSYTVLYRFEDGSSPRMTSCESAEDVLQHLSLEDQQAFVDGITERYLC